MYLKPGSNVDVQAVKDRIVIDPAATKSWRGIGKDMADDGGQNPTLIANDKAMEQTEQAEVFLLKAFL